MRKDWTELTVLFRKMPQLVVWRKAWGREDWEKGIQTDSCNVKQQNADGGFISSVSVEWQG